MTATYTHRTTAKMIEAEDISSELYRIADALERHIDPNDSDASSEQEFLENLALARTHTLTDLIRVIQGHGLNVVAR